MNIGVCKECSKQTNLDISNTCDKCFILFVSLLDMQAATPIVTYSGSYGNPPPDNVNVFKLGELEPYAEFGGFIDKTDNVEPIAWEDKYPHKRVVEPPADFETVEISYQSLEGFKVPAHSNEIFRHTDGIEYNTVGFTSTGVLVERYLPIIDKEATTRTWTGKPKKQSCFCCGDENEGVRKLSYHCLGITHRTAQIFACTVCFDRFIDHHGPIKLFNNVTVEHAFNNWRLEFGPS